MANPNSSESKIRAVVLGASGYTGAELVRLLMAHRHVEIAALTGSSQAGQPIHAIYPHLRGLGLPDLITMEAVNWRGVDVAFCCLPHGASQKAVSAIPASVVVIDLSADFRLKDAKTYAEWYGEHPAPEKLAEAVYAMPELNRAEIKNAQLIACPGCYPTASQLPLVPLLREGIIAADSIIIDAKSGVTGAGRSLKQSNLYTEVNEGIGAYAIGHHRHMPEIEQGLSQAAGKPVTISFTPHLVPMNRGILTTIYVGLASGKTVEDARKALRKAYEGEAFVTICDDKDAPPTTHQVRGSNRCMIALYPDRAKGRMIIVSVIDNLLKGASGQAVQNMNLRFGFPEAMGLEGAAIFP